MMWTVPSACLSEIDCNAHLERIPFMLALRKELSHSEAAYEETNMARDYWGMPDHNQGETGCLGYFYIVMIKHNGQGNL